ncbi:hypothetical protein PVK06_030897 [Gossypium arboreum]|uniref:Uncharacterized protein n=1 Tax=Gossypium arboreum TaxID=29729 RepID=A0ABR0NQ40_GOSAR|nr:hypothetical protein PVK06_030897 [Gossypium arboreum]
MNSAATVRPERVAQGDVDCHSSVGRDAVARQGQMLNSATNNGTDADYSTAVDDDVDAWYLSNVPEIWGTL